MRVGRGGVPGRHGGERPISPASTDSDLAVRGEGSTQAGRVRLWTAWWGPDKGHRWPSLQPSPGTAQLSLSRNVASASGAAVGGWSPRRASAGESGRRLCKATSGWAGAFCPSAGQNHSHVLWELLAPAREPRAGDPSRAQGHLCCQVQGAAAALRLCPTCWT